MGMFRFKRQEVRGDEMECRKEEILNSCYSPVLSE
jgi:hypothetical protein